uniref:Uncharacterized protein n=1 Tax=Arundo donax TaxID=35708 RepID=A0A0A9F3J5_ARUDO
MTNTCLLSKPVQNKDYRTECKKLAKDLFYLTLLCHSANQTLPRDPNA